MLPTNCCWRSRTKTRFVVKELLENAVDAKASDIKLIKDAGKALVQVIDNGLGMSVTDARLCFERHATSKYVRQRIYFHCIRKGFVGKLWLQLLRLLMWR
jgi:DNA mismatch repair protein MutL